MLKEDGQFRQPGSGQELVEELESLSSPVLAFVRERCVEEPGASVEVQSLFAEWLTWCQAMHREASGDCQGFGRNLRAAFPHLRVDRPRRGDERVRVYQGLRLRHPGEVWSATVRGHFNSTRGGEERSNTSSIEPAIDRTADHRGPDAPPLVEHPCVTCGVEVDADAMFCHPCWSRRQSRREHRPMEVPS